MALARRDGSSGKPESAAAADMHFRLGHFSEAFRIGKGQITDSGFAALNDRKKHDAVKSLLTYAQASSRCGDAAACTAIAANCSNARRHVQPHSVIDMLLVSHTRSILAACRLRDLLGVLQAQARCIAKSMVLGFDSEQMS